MDGESNLLIENNYTYLSIQNFEQGQGSSIRRVFVHGDILRKALAAMHFSGIVTIQVISK